MNKISAIIAAAILSMTSYHASAKPIETVVTPPKVERWIVRDDGGGRVTDFTESLSYMKKNKMAIKLGGYCASACTLILSKEYDLDVCVMKDIKFGFHQPFAMDSLGRVYYTIPFIVQAEKLWKQEFYAKYPDWAKKLIDENGGVPAVYKGHTPQAVLWLDYSKVSKHMKTCL